MIDFPRRHVLSCVFLFLLVSPIPAGPKVLVVDPGDSDTGVLCRDLFRHLDPQTSIQKVDLAQLPAVAKIKWDLVAWIGPEPLLYRGEVKQAYESIVADPSIGLLVVKLPHDEAGRASLFKSLKPRNGPKPGVHLRADFNGCAWIWADGRRAPDERISLMKTFDLAEAPSNAWLQISADNDAHVWINGIDIGNTTSWRTPVCFSVAQVLRSGVNTIGVDAWNEDGPAGLLASLVAFDEDGKTLIDVRSDGAWQWSSYKNDAWDHVSRGRREWKPAKKIFDFGAGPWESKLRAPYPAFEAVISQGESPLGRAVLSDGLQVEAGSTTLAMAGKIPIAVATEGSGGRLVLYAIDPEASEGIATQPAVTANAFGHQLLQQAQWLVNAQKRSVFVGEDIPDDAVGGQAVQIGIASLASPIEIESIMRDDDRVILHDVRKFPPSSGSKLTLRLPQPWMAQGPVRLQLTARAHGVSQDVRIATIHLQTPLTITLTPRDDRWVYRADETIAVSAALSDPKLAATRLRAMINSSDGRPVMVLPPSDHWTADLSLLKPGRYDFVVQYLSPDQQILGHAAWRFDVVERPKLDRLLTRAIQFTTIPRDGVPADDGAFPRSRDGLRRAVENIIDHGFNSLYTPINLPREMASFVESYAQSRGMTITSWPDVGPLELFNRGKSPLVSVYSPEYPAAVRKKAQGVLDWLHRYPRLAHAILYMDEPFWQHPNLWPMDEFTKTEFHKRYGYELPATAIDAARDPKQWMDLLNFRTAQFSDAWKQVYTEIKKLDKSFEIVLNHDSHNTFGGGAGQESPIAADDAFHWGGHAFADALSWDIYPYLMSDFRYGPNRQLKLPRMAQLHYSAAYMRNLANEEQVRLGYWYGPWNAEWFDLDEEGRAQYWMERETAYTALAHGANMLVTGINIPQDQKHWDDLGESMRAVAKVDEALVQCPRLRAKAAMLFPRTQYLQLQEEYFGVGQSYEAFSRAFGELDILHEEQVAERGVGDYRILVIFDVKLLPMSVATQIDRFAKAGGIVIADCVPNMDESKRPLIALEKMFGVTQAQTDRLRWPVLKPQLPNIHTRVLNPLFSGVYHSAYIRDHALGVPLDLAIASPRVSVPTNAKLLAKTVGRTPALTLNSYGKGRVYLLGFCLQDADFVTWALDDVSSRTQMQKLLRAITDDAGVNARVRSSNPDVEVGVRANENGGFLFVISHEAKDGKARIELRDLPFPLKSISDVQSEGVVEFRREADAVVLEVDAPTGTTRLLRMQ